MSENYKEHFLNHYNNFLNQLKVIFPFEEEILNNLSNLSDDEKIKKGLLFNSLLTDTNFDLFTKKKIKVFSHKNDDTRAISESLFGSNFSIKNVLNNQPDEVKDIIWNNMYVLCMLAELLQDNKDDNRVNLLNKIICNEKKLKNIEEILGLDINNETSGMLNDIMNSFEKILNTDADPLSNIMKISQKISAKYADKINRGDIELDKLMETVTKKIPGMDQLLSGAFSKRKPKDKIIIDENFSTANVDVGLNKEDDNKSLNLSNIMNIVKKFNIVGGNNTDTDFDFLKTLPGMDNIPNMDKLIEMMKKLENTLVSKENPQEGENVKTDEYIHELQKEMETFLQSNLGIDIDKLNANLADINKS